MKNENEITNSIINKSMKKSLESKDSKEPVYEMTIESEKGRKEIINIYPNSKPEEIAYNFCKDNNLDFETLELMINQIKKLMKSIEQKKEQNNKNNIDTENENKLFYCKEPILEDSEEQHSLSTEKIIRTKSFKENILKNKEKEKKIDFDNNNNIDNNIDLDNNIKSIDNMNYFKINKDFQEKKVVNSKTNSIITNTINNCLEIIEKEEKNMPSSISTFTSKLGSSSSQNKKFLINSKENITTFNIEKEKDNIKYDSNNNNYLVNKNISRNINVSKSFINKIPKNINKINNNILNTNSRNNFFIVNNNNSNSNIKNKQMNIIELDSKNRTVSDEHKYSNKNKIQSLKNSSKNNKFNLPTSPNSYYSNYSNKQKELLKNNNKNKNKKVLRMINQIKKNNIDLNQLNNENLIKNYNNTKMKKSTNNNKEQMINNNINDKIKPKKSIQNRINNKKTLKINNITSNYIQNSKDNYIYYDTTDKDPFYSLSKYEDNSTLNNLIKNSMSINSHHFSNLNSIKHEINMTILSKQQKKIINIPTPKNNNINNYKNNKIKYRNCQTCSNVENKKPFLSNDKLFKNFKSKILLTKSNNISNSRRKKTSEDKKKMSPISDNNKSNNKIKKNKDNLDSNSRLLIREFFNEVKLNKFRNNFKSPRHKANTSQTTMKNFIIKKNKTNMYKDSFTNNNRILFTQSSRNNNLNDCSSTTKHRCNSFNDYNSNINNIFINLKYSNNKKFSSLLGYLDKFNLDNNSYFMHHQNKKKFAKKRNVSNFLSSNKLNSNSFGNKKSINDTIDKAIINNMNLNLNITTQSNSNSYSFKNKKKLNSNYCPNLKNNLNNKISSKSNLNKKRPCYLFIKSQNSSPPSTSRSKRRKKNHSTLLQNSNININLLKKNKITNSLKHIFYIISNKTNKIDISKINKNNNIFIPDDIAKSVLFIIQNCEKNKNIINNKEFILKGAFLFDCLPLDEQISILNYSDK